MKVMEQELYKNTSNGLKARIMRSPSRYKLTIWDRWSVVHTESYADYKTAHDVLVKAGFVKG